MIVYFDGTEVNDYITELSRSEKIFDTSFILGTTLCREVDLSVVSTYTGGQPSLVTITDDDGTQILPSLHVDSVDTTDATIIKYKLFDAMIYGNKAYYPTYENDGTTFTTILSNIASVLGVSLASSASGVSGLTKTTSVNDSTISCRDYLCMIAEYNCGYFYIDVDDTLAFASWNEDVATTIAMEDCGDFTLGNAVSINRLSHSVYTYPVSGDDDTTYGLNENNQLIEEESDVAAIYALMSSITFYNITVNRGTTLETLRGGQAIQFTDGTDYWRSIANFDWKYQGGWTGGYNLDVQDMAQSSTSVVGTDEKITGAITIVKDYTDLSISTTVTEIAETYETITDAETMESTLQSQITTNETNITQNATDITALATRVTTAEGNITTNTASIEVNADAITSAVTSMTEYTDSAIDGMVIGGRNYLVNSDFSDSTNNWGAVNSSTIELIDSDYGTALTATKGTSDNLYYQASQLPYLIANGEVSTVVSFTGYLPEDSAIYVYGFISSGGWKRIGFADVDGTSGWARYEVPMTISSSSYEGNVIVVWATTDADYMYLYHPQFELGTKATEWKLSDYELQSSIITNATSIEQNATDITALATRVTTNEDNIETNTANITINANAITSAVTSMTEYTDEAISNLSTDNTNLIRNSNFAMGSSTASATYWYNGSSIATFDHDNKIVALAYGGTTTAYRIYTNPSTNFVHTVGTIYTLSFDAYATASATLGAGEYDAMHTFSITTTSTRYSVTYTATLSEALSIQNQTSGTTIYITNIKMEYGEKATEWCLNSNDVESRITTNTTSIEQNADDITSLASRVTTNEENIETNTTSIEQNAEDITLTATTLTSAIDAKASQDDLDYISRSVVVDSGGVTIQRDGYDAYSHFDETGMQIYVNGNEVAEATSSQFISNGDLSVNGWNIAIGSSSNILNFTKGS